MVLWLHTLVTRVVLTSYTVVTRPVVLHCTHYANQSTDNARYGSRDEGSLRQDMWSRAQGSLTRNASLYAEPHLRLTSSLDQLYAQATGLSPVHEMHVGVHEMRQVVSWNVEGGFVECGSEFIPTVLRTVHCYGSAGYCGSALFVLWHHPAFRAPEIAQGAVFQRLTPSLHPATCATLCCSATVPRSPVLR